MDIEQLQALAEAETPQVREIPLLVPGLVMHLDGDMICYHCAGGDDMEPGRARIIAAAFIEKLRIYSGAETVVVHMTAPHCHKGERYLIATVKPYQGNRAGSKKPKNHGYLQDWLMSYDGPHFRVKSWASREADDGIAACAYHAAGSSGPGHIVIATADKDMRMLPGLHIDWKTQELIRVPLGAYDVVGKQNGKQYGTKWFWLQMLQGDAADNIPGLPKYYTTDAKGKPAFKLMGEKTAEKFLAGKSSNEAAFAEVYGLYQEYYLNARPELELSRSERASLADDRFVEQAALLWMRSDGTASIDNFVRHQGHGCISTAFPDELRSAANKLVNRVKGLRDEADALRH